MQEACELVKLCYTSSIYIAGLVGGSVSQVVSNQHSFYDCELLERRFCFVTLFLASQDALEVMGVTH